jgi:hypothetical protein
VVMTSMMQKTQIANAITAKPPSKNNTANPHSCDDARLRA